jgi:hypothetical protein
MVMGYIIVARRHYARPVLQIIHVEAGKSVLGLESTWEDE